MNRREAIRHGFLVGLFTALGEMPKLLGGSFIDAPIMNNSELTIDMDIILLKVGDIIGVPGGMKFLIVSMEKGVKATAKNTITNYSIQNIHINHKSTEQLEADSPQYKLISSNFSEALKNK